MSGVSARAATPCSPAASSSAAKRCRSRTSTSPRSALGSLAKQLQGFSWLRDLAARRRAEGRRLAEAVVGRWLLAHGTRVDGPGRRISGASASSSDRLRALHPVERRQRLSLGLAQHARARRPPRRFDRRPRCRRARPVTAWCGVVAAGLLVQGGVPRVARGEAGLARRSPRRNSTTAASSAARPMNRSSWSTASAFCAPATWRPSRLCRRHRGSGAGIARRASRHHDGRRRPVELARLRSRRGGASTALIDGCGLRARPLRQARGWGYQRMSALGTVLVLDAAPPPPQKVAEQGSASTLAFELSDGSQRLVVNCGGPGPLPRLFPKSWSRASHTAAHSTLILADTNSTNILADGTLGKGVEDVTIERSDDNDASRLEASHDGYVRSFGMIHKRSLMLGNDGKELRGADQLSPRAARRSATRRPMPSVSTSPPGSKPTITADGMGAILRSRARRRGTSAVAAATSRSRKASGSTAGAGRTTSSSLSSWAKCRHWAATSAGPSAAPANPRGTE